MRRRVPRSTGRTTVSSALHHQTRPILLLDPSQNQLSVFSADEGGGAIYLKQAALDDPRFGSEKGTPFISNASYPLIDNPTSTKQTVSAASGMVVLASDEPRTRYLHNALITTPVAAPSQHVYLPALLR